MGIVNLTPDSFSGDGLMNGQNLITGALRQCDAFLENGADIRFGHRLTGLHIQDGAVAALAASKDV